jgi:hypothetical protein
LNIDRSNEEHDVWANQILAAHNSEDWGIYTLSQPDNKLLQEYRKKLYSINQDPDYVQSNKWTGKPSDDWNRVNHFVHSRVVG